MNSGGSSSVRIPNERESNKLIFELFCQTLIAGNLIFRKLSFIHLKIWQQFFWLSGNVKYVVTDFALE